ncbi:MAG: NACHT domain-containing protein [Lachnospiraceae bacterium]|nr:NACHT domain-containing protein [Lachnospiraceae bacterium]
MEDVSYPRLCGGTFLNLLLQEKKINRSTGKEYPNSVYLRGLAEIFDDVPKGVFVRNTAAVTTSNYKACKSNNTGMLNLQRPEYAERARLKMDKEFGSCLEKMKCFVEAYLRVSDRDNWIGHALLELLENDQEILPDTELFFRSNGSSVKKKDFLENKEQEIYFPALMLGIWFYIIDHQVDNTVGEDTYISWVDQKGKFASDIGKSYPRRAITMVYEKGEGDNSTYEQIEVVTDQDFIVEQSRVTERARIYSEYLKKVQSKTEKIKTLLYANEPTDFYSFYECNNLRRRVYIKKSESYQFETYSNITAEQLPDIAKCFIISGVGGLGKSMMMKHLLLSAVSSFEKTGILPVLVSLKDYSHKKHLGDFIYESVESSGFNVDKEDFFDLLRAGKCLLLLDGYDEIKNDERSSFDVEIEIFIDRFHKNQFVMSSRPAFSFINLGSFVVLELCHLTRPQAISMVRKLQYDADIKTRFINAINNGLYYTHPQFIGNPLLLTITLMTYDRFAEIPDQKHLFYREAYETLASKHDATKGAFKRELNTKLSLDDFEKYLSEFCARTYKEEKFELVDLEIQHFFNGMNLVKRNQPDFSYVEFRDDMKDKVCLMYKDGDAYLFIHRSFQEYFCALYFSRQKDKHLKKIGDFFNRKRNRLATDQTFEMLYNMIRNKVEEYMFFPYLQERIQKWEQEKGYWSFLEEVYPCIYYSNGETAYDYGNEPGEYLYEFIGKTHDLLEQKYIFDLPYDEGLITHRYVIVNENWEEQEEEENWSLVDVDEVDELYIDRYGEPDVEGCNLEVEVSEIINNPDMYEEFCDIIEQESFPMKKEYRRFLAYYDSLKRMYEKIADDDELFDGLE